MKILVVEDEQDLRETIRTSLQKEKFTVENIVTESGGINDNTGEGTLPPVNTLNEF